MFSCFVLFSSAKAVLHVGCCKKFHCKSIPKEGDRYRGRTGLLTCFAVRRNKTAIVTHKLHLAFYVCHVKCNVNNAKRSFVKQEKKKKFVALQIQLGLEKVLASVFLGEKCNSQRIKNFLSLSLFLVLSLSDSLSYPILIFFFLSLFLFLFP